MSKCNFTIPFSGSAEETVARAQSGIEENGGSFNGNTSAGTFSVKVLGTINGSYTISGQEISIDIEAKPLFISCSQIEQFMKKSIGK